MANVQSVDERLQIDLGRSDHRPAHDQILAGMAGLSARLREHFDLTPHPSTAHLAAYGRNGLEGSLTGSTGPDIAWLIESWLGSPDQGFTNHHITAWLPSDTRVPHLGVALGTIPQLFFYVDLIPRTDLSVDIEALDRYFEPLNALYLEVAADPDFDAFITRETYIRQVLSPACVCVTAEVTEANIERCVQWVHRVLDLWIGWVDTGEPVPASERDALARRDARVRGTIIDRDPANVLAERALGAELTGELLHHMKGEGRTR